MLRNNSPGNPVRWMVRWMRGIKLKDSGGELRERLGRPTV